MRKKMINQKILADTMKWQNNFKSADLHKHICLDNFFDSDIANGLLKEFPAFDNMRAINEFGQVGPKCVHTNIKAIGPTYEKLHNYIRSEEFLSAISALTGIPDLLPDPNLYGGGTHENVDGAELDPHVDFNYDPTTHYHRRLNVLFYLNHDWNEDWGGAIEFHSDPTEWRSGNNKVISYNCAFNRCVIFATSENSWHGFKRIKLPREKKEAGISRKLISIYLYTKERPQEEIAPSHGTFYIPYPPNSIETQNKIGKHMLQNMFQSTAVAVSNTDYSEMLRLVEKRDKLLKASYEKEKYLSGEIEKYSRYFKELFSSIHPNFQGYVEPVLGNTYGYFHDKWILNNFSTVVKCNKSVKEILIHGWIPSNQIIELDIKVNGMSCVKSLSDGIFDINISQTIDSGNDAKIEIKAMRTQGNINNSDGRGDLVFILNGIVFIHK
jgi:Rps23 Pro-64 3,4-dihydroxylase Tpa1-like proline 4-hydroxylase